MPIHGLHYGIDTGDQLKNKDWVKIRALRQVNPVFAGRYFNPTSSHLWVQNEATNIKQKNPDLAYILPLQGATLPPFFHRERGEKPNGQKEDSGVVSSWGIKDAQATCDNIWAIVKRKELLFPASNSVIVYLDIENGVNLSPDYWYGWAKTIFWYSTGLFQWPFYAGIYCTTVHDPVVHDQADPRGVKHRIPANTPNNANFGDVQTGLTADPNNLASRCYGIYASNPIDDKGFVGPSPPPKRYEAGFEPDWEDRFQKPTPSSSSTPGWQQTVKIFGLIPWHTDVPVRLWQYAAEPIPMDPNTNPVTASYFNNLHIDLDETTFDSKFDPVNWMLKLP
jgi:hypothetical protein